jgi:antitoxin HigA-1
MGCRANEWCDGTGRPYEGLAETALRLGRYFGNSAEFWMRLQAGYDLAVAERDMGERVMRAVEVA